MPVNKLKQMAQQDSLVCAYFQAQFTGNYLVAECWDSYFPEDFSPKAWEIIKTWADNRENSTEIDKKLINLLPFKEEDLDFKEIQEEIKNEDGETLHQTTFVFQGDLYAVSLYYSSWDGYVNNIEPTDFKIGKLKNKRVQVFVPFEEENDV